MSEFSTYRSSFISRADLRKRIYAFLVTSTAVFILTCLIWPLSVTGFRSVAEITVLAGDSESTEQLERMLGFAVKHETEDSRLSSMVEKLESQGKLRSRQIEMLDNLSIKDAIKFGVTKTNQQYQLSVVFDGEGGDDERALVDMLTARVAARLATDANQQTAGRAPLEKLEQANWIVDQIEKDLDFVKSSLDQLAANPTQLPSLNGSTGAGNGRRFRQASSSKIATPRIDQLEQTIESIDTQALRTLIGEIQQQVINPAANANSGKSDDAVVAVTGLSLSKTIPIRGMPGFGVLLTLVAFAGLVGTVIAGHYQPFETRGFSRVDAVAKMLGVPVVAAIRQRDDAPNSAGAGVSWANRVVKTSGLIVFGVFVVVTGFILINPDVRQAFFENPFFGCAKIVRIFVGY